MVCDTKSMCVEIERQIFARKLKIKIFYAYQIAILKNYPPISSLCNARKTN